MKTIAVTGATGFIGRHVVEALLVRDYRVILLTRSPGKIAEFPWRDKVSVFEVDLYADNSSQQLAKAPAADVLVHLAWAGLPNYEALYHIETNLFSDLRFLRCMLERGIRHVIVTGTCLEYGLQNGRLFEHMPSIPQNPYALAKDTLRKYLEMMQKEMPFVLQWLRLFYAYGKGQNPKSLLSQLDKAIDNGETEFKMSMGEQLRDFLPIETTAGVIAQLVSHPECHGVLNCCSGNPISVRRVVETRIRERNANIALNLGYYAYPAYEPMAFWGDDTKIRKIKEAL